MKELRRFGVLGRAELDMLEPWRDQMSYSQLVSVMTKMNLRSVDPQTELAWRVCLESKRRDPLEMGFDELPEQLRIEADHTNA